MYFLNMTFSRIDFSFKNHSYQRLIFHFKLVLLIRTRFSINKKKLRQIISLDYN